ncbi:hypothetical protein MBCUT_12960 [Methanobrevibacter cuticularis]|uniref:Uncharacterized protein n=1 Tax=Methanobrevibacter cuticularis TaxID=47311 RepID=A0A166DNK9_9EURY|nr:hypothetical protein [Methanobrevibacter cuticularis]KZX15792.1 hypothetical protein MBCUT_12960 [Methanobrevibacter cuticularis]
MYYILYDFYLIINHLLTNYGVTFADLESAAAFMTALAVFATLYLARKDSQKLNSANVIAHYMNHKHAIYLVVKNIGSSEAYNVKIYSKQADRITNNKPLKSLLNREIQIMPAQLRIVTLLDSGKTENKELDSDISTYEVTIEFTDIYKAKHKKNYRINLDMIRSMTVTGDYEDTVEEGLINIKNSLNKSNEEIKELKESLKYISNEKR